MSQSIISNQSTISNVIKSVNSNDTINTCAGIVLKSDANTKVSIGSINQIQIDVNGPQCNYIPGPEQEQYVSNSSASPPACKEMTIIQSSDQDVQIVNTVNQTVLTEQQKKMFDALSQQIKNDVMNMNATQKAMVQQLLNLKSADDVTNTVLESLKADIDTKLTVQTISTVIGAIHMSNSVKLNVCGVLSSDTCTIDQSNIVQLQVKNYVNAVANVVQANPLISKINTMLNAQIVQPETKSDWITFCQNHEIELLLGFLIILMLIMVFCLMCKNY